MTQDARLSSLLARYARTRAPEDRDALVTACLPLSCAVARRFAGWGVETEDLEQVAAMALMQAVERFEPERGLRFSTFATPTIAGAVRNYIRDKGSIIRQSRDVREQLGRLGAAQERLTRRLGREPSLRELAAELSLTQEELLRLLDQRGASEVLSLSGTLSPEDGRSLEDRLGAREGGYEAFEQRAWLDWVLSQVTPQEKRLLTLRFVDRLSQRETAARLGVSQMQVSRVERRVLARLREKVERWEAPE